MVVPRQTGRQRCAVATFAVALIHATGCASLGPPRADVGGSIHQSVSSVAIGARTLDLHLAQRSSITPGQPLVIFASGDGGWFGSAIGMFDTIAAAGYPVVGVSSRSLLRTLRTEGRSISAVHIIDAYRRIIGAARTALQIPSDTAVIVAGWSRGAALSVIVGAEDRSDDISGSIAIGLAAEEDLNVDLDSDDSDGGRPGVRSASQIDTYALLHHIPRRVAVIQASGDAYLAADRARVLFGADSVDRRFFEVRASNHRFGGGGDAFRTALAQALNWISLDEGLLK